VLLSNMLLTVSMALLVNVLQGHAARDSASDGHSEPVRVEVLKAPDDGIQPQAVIDKAGVVHLVYFKGEPAAGDLFYTRIEPGKGAFAAPVRVNSQRGSAVAIGTIRGAHIALGRHGHVHIAWNGSNQAVPKNTFGSNPMLYSRSDSAGRAFEPQRNVMRRTSALDGGGSVAADWAGNVYVAWHGHSEDSAGGELGRRIWTARSTDDGATFSAEEPALDKQTGACGCCGIRALADSQGRIYILYRGAGEGGAERDMYLLSSRDHGEHFDGNMIHPWKINGCPMSSASLAEQGDRVTSAWETNQQVYFARIDPGSGKLSPPAQPPGNADRKHPAVACNQRGETIVVWTEGTGWQKGGTLGWQLFDPDSRPTDRKGRVEGGIPVWGLPTVVARPDGSFLILH
jgi:hypothetical protein